MNQYPQEKQMSASQTLVFLLRLLYHSSMWSILNKFIKQNKKTGRFVKARGVGWGRVVLSAAVLILSLFVFTGCIPNNYTREEEKAFLKEAKTVALDYLGDAYSGAAVKAIEAETTVGDNGYELTEFASGQFVWQKQQYDFVVNTETGEVYTSVLLSEIKERLLDELMQELGIVSREASMVSYGIHYLRGCEKANVYLSSNLFTNVFPEGESADELFDRILGDEEEYMVSVTLQYKGEDIPREIIEGNAPFPTLSHVRIYRVAEEHGLYEGEYNYGTLPSLSAEVLYRSYADDAAEYTENRVLEREGFLVVYNAYEMKREQDKVETAVIDVEDIILTVTDDYIDLDCTKDHFVMYLFTTDEEMTKKYLYAYYYILHGDELQTVTWYPYEDVYVYAGTIYSQTPYDFTSRYSEANRIYSQQNF